jgi:lysine 2,3-aminomutase
MVGPEKGSALRPDELDKALDYIASDPRIWEVILTGGDPFMLSAVKVQALMDKLDRIDHVKIVRWHTRMPVADPDRIDQAYVNALIHGKKTPIVVTHANHSNEFTASTKSAIQRMANAGISLRSQSVLLKGVNDNLDALGQLMRTFVENRIQPYYLHQLDYAPGTSHFRVPVETGQKLLQDLRDTYSGLCIRHYVIDFPGGVSKASFGPADIRQTDGKTELRGRDSHWHPYPSENT